MEVTKWYGREQANSFMENASCNFSKVRVVMRRRGNRSTALTLPCRQCGLEKSRLHCCGGLTTLPHHSPESRRDILISLEHTALSVLQHSSCFKWQAVEQSDCFIDTAKRGVRFLALGQMPSLREKTLWCIETSQVRKDFRNFKGLGGARNNKKENDKHSAESQASKNP